MESGDDPAHDYSKMKKDQLEAKLRRQGRDALRAGDAKLRNRRDAQAVEISRRKSKRAHQHGI